MTKYEKAIYDIINMSYEHLSVEQTFMQLKQTYPGVALATVYNNINRLWEAGLIRKISVEGTVDRYDRIQRHDHLVCKRCGQISDITFEDLTETLRDKVGREVFLAYDLKVFYLCPACREQNEGQ